MCIVLLQTSNSLKSRTRICFIIVGALTASLQRYHQGKVKVCRYKGKCASKWQVYYCLECKVLKVKNCTCARVSRCVKVEHSGQAECLLSRALGRSQGRSVGHKHRLHRIKSPRYLFSLTGQPSRPIELEIENRPSAAAISRSWEVQVVLSD